MRELSGLCPCSPDVVDCPRCIKSHKNTQMSSCGPMLGGRRRTILRKGYERHVNGKTVRVPAARITDMGAPGKWAEKHGPGIGELRPGGLSSTGYSVVTKKTARHRSLKKAVKKFGPLSTFRKLQAISTYTKRTSPTKSKTFKTDSRWVKKTFLKK